MEADVTLLFSDGDRELAERVSDMLAGNEPQTDGASVAVAVPRERFVAMLDQVAA